MNTEKGKATIDFTANVTLKAHYNMDGQVLILPIRGNGAAKIKISEYHSMLHYYGPKYFINRNSITHSEADWRRNYLIRHNMEQMCEYVVNKFQQTKTSFYSSTMYINDFALEQEVWRTN